jgi:hypothetical protein
MMGQSNWLIAKKKEKKKKKKKGTWEALHLNNKRGE